MHELFTKVLAKRDLSRAGDLFSLADAEIVNDLTDVLNEIEVIVSQPDYLQNKNDQSVMEICVTRVTSCIRESKSVERHCTALVSLLSTCLKHNLQSLDEEPPHAKISADLISSIFLNYNKKNVMEAALPVAIRFLQKGNKELSRNLASYLSLAAIEYAYLLGPHMSQILDSIAIGNYGLCQILPQIYEVSPDVLDKKVIVLVPLLRCCDVQEKLALLQLFTLMAKRNIMAFEGSVHQIADTVTTDSNQVATGTLALLLKLAEQFPVKLFDHFDKIKCAAEKHPLVVAMAAQVLATAGKRNRPRAQFALDFVLQYLPQADRSTQAILLREATLLCSTYPVLFNEKVLACVRQKNNNSPAMVGPPAVTTTTTTIASDSGSGTATAATMTTSTKTTTSTNKSPSQQPAIEKIVNKSKVATTAIVPNGTTTIATTTTASGGVTIVKLNVTSPVAAQQQHQLSTPIESTAATTTTMTTTTSNGVLPAVSTDSKGSSVGGASMLAISTNSGGGGTGAMTAAAAAAAAAATVNGGTTGVTSPPHTGYTRRAKLGDSRSTGRLHSTGNTHRSMTRLNIAGGSVGGLHKSMTRLSSSQQINNNNLNNNNNNNVNSNNNHHHATAIGSNMSTNQNPSHSSGNLSAYQLQNGPNSVQSRSNGTTLNHVAPVPPLSSNVIITGHNKWGIPSTRITSGGVTVTTSPTRTNRPQSQGPSTLLSMSGSSGALGSMTNCNKNNYNVTTAQPPNTVSVHHAAPASPTSSIMTLPVNNQVYNSPAHTANTNQVTVTSRRNDHTSVTIINAANSPMPNQRMSVFEPIPPERDTIQHFSEKHYEKIKVYIDNVEQRVPPAAKCTIEERRAKKFAKLHFACQMRGPHCLYNAKTLFTMRTRNPKTWIHLMFLDQQARAGTALSSRDAAVSSLRHCWDILKCENKAFVTLATSAFPPQKDIDAVVNELRNSGYFDVFELGPWTAANNNNSNSSNNNNSNGTSSNGNNSSSTSNGGGGGVGGDNQQGKDELGESIRTKQWGCFLCNHPDKASSWGLLQGNMQPVIEGQLKEKKGKWRLFRRWRTRYFTLSGAHLSCKGSSGGESIDINQIRSLKVSRGARNIPKAFEIFTGDQTLILKPKDGKNAEEWVQCLSIVVAHSQARDQPPNKTNSLPARGLGNSRTAF